MLMHSSWAGLLLVLTCALPASATTLAFGGPAPVRDVAWTLAGLAPNAGRVSDAVEVDTDGAYRVLCTWTVGGPVEVEQALELYLVTASASPPADSAADRGAGGTLLGRASGPDASATPTLTLDVGLSLQAGQGVALALWNNTRHALATDEAGQGCVLQLLE